MLPQFLRKDVDSNGYKPSLARREVMDATALRESGLPQRSQMS